MNITHDLHIHTHLSPCGERNATAEAYAKIFKEKGIKKAGFADHFWDDSYENSHEWLNSSNSLHGPWGFYVHQNFEHICKLKEELKGVDFGDTEILFGCETDYDPLHRRPAISCETAEKLDFILMPNSHTQMVMPKAYYEPYEKHVEYMAQIYEDSLDSDVSKYITAMAHPFEAVCCPYDKGILLRLVSDDLCKRIFSKTAEKGIAVEINIACMRERNPQQIADSEELRFYRIAKEEGCVFTFGSDSHSNVDHKTFGNATIIAGLLGLTKKDLHHIVR